MRENYPITHWGFLLSAPHLQTYTPQKSELCCDTLAAAHAPAKKHRKNETVDPIDGVPAKLRKSRTYSTSTLLYVTTSTDMC